MNALNLGLHNVAQTVARENAPDWRLSRVSQDVRAGLNAGAAQRAFTTSGCELRFTHDAPVTVTLARIVSEWDAQCLDSRDGPRRALQTGSRLHVPPEGLEDWVLILELI